MSKTEQPPRRSAPKRGLVMVNTGDGKGKSTAAFGVLFRAWGYDLRVAVMQFMKAETGNWGEVRAARKLGIQWQASGDGFTWKSKDLDESAAKARHGWVMAQELIASGDYDIVLLDEMTYPLDLKWIDVHEVIDWLRANRPEKMHVIITGRNAPQELIEFADLVTEMGAVKHPFADQGMHAQRGIDF